MHQINIIPMPGKVVIKRVEVEETTASGIIMPGAKSERPEQGEVVAVPHAIDASHPYLKVGDKVAFKKWEVDEIKVDGEDYLVIDEKSVLAILNTQAQQ